MNGRFIARVHPAADHLRWKCFTLIVFIAFVAAPNVTGQGDVVELVWEARLEALQPSRPEEYFDLAEEIADEAEAEIERDLARHLFRLAGALDRSRFGRSACLALADLSGSSADKRRFLALAELLDQSSGRPNWVPDGSPTRAPSHDLDSAFAVAEAMSWYRLARGRRALATLDDRGATLLFQKYADLIGGWLRFKTDAELRDYNNGQGTPVRSESQLIDMLHLEAGLLGAGGEETEQSWAGDLLLNKGQTLIEVDSSRLAEALNVDPARAVYRNGAWTRE